MLKSQLTLLTTMLKSQLTTMLKSQLTLLTARLKSQLTLLTARLKFQLTLLGARLWQCTFALPDRQQAVLVAVAEGPLGGRLEVPGVDAATGHRVAALAHAGVVAQPALVQVGVGQCVAAGDTLGLHERYIYRRTRRVRHGEVQVMEE